MPPELQETIVADIMQDQISSSNPLAPLVAVPILEAVGVLQAKPTLVLLPDDVKLGEFREEFGGLLGMIEIHPEEAGDEDETGFANSEKISGTLKLLETLEEKRNQKINDKELLKARLVDIFLGDWDRHTDQWRWARYDEGEKKTWLPIPRDRDQVFSKYDGVFPSIAEYVVPQLNTFDYDYPKAVYITWNGRFVDRRFLTELDKPAWDSVTQFVKSRLTDEVIENAVKRLPGESYQIAGEELTSKLKSRRDKLTDISNEFYDLVNEVVDIYGSSKDDLFEVNRISDSETSITVYKKNKDDGGKTSEIYYHKVFDNTKTDEFRLYLLDGDDSIVLNGEVDVSPLVRIIGGDGRDKIVDNSVVNGNFLSVIPIPDAENKTKVYDSGNKTEVIYGAGTCWDDDKYPESKNLMEKYEPKLRDRGSEWFYKPVIGFNSDDGFILGSGFILYSYNFRMHPLEYKIDLSAAYATNPKSYIISFNGDFYSVVKGALLNLDFYLSELSLTKYYGFGNETDYNKDLEAADYYQLNHELLTIHPSLKFPLFKNLSADFGFSYDYSDIFLRNDTLLSNFKDKSYGLNTMKLAGVHALLEFDSRGVPANPFLETHESTTNHVSAVEADFFLKLSGEYFPEVLDNRSAFVKTGFDARTYVTTNFITDITLALRAGGEKLFGAYPFFKAAFLGGGDNLRGYNRERFSGDASLFGQAELRFYLTDIKLIVNGRFGFFGFAETGRVFIEHDNSEKWHPSYGGGFWISYLNKTVNLNLALANSEETLIFYFLTRFMF